MALFLIQFLFLLLQFYYISYSYIFLLLLKSWYWAANTNLFISLSGFISLNFASFGLLILKNFLLLVFLFDWLILVYKTDSLHNLIWLLILIYHMILIDKVCYLIWARLFYYYFSLSLSLSHIYIYIYIFNRPWVWA